MYTVSISDPSRIALATHSAPLPHGSGDLLPKAQVLTDDGQRVFYLAATNSPIDRIPRTDLMVADITSGAVASVTSSGNPDRAPYSTTKATFMAGGVTTLTTARDLVNSPFDKANLVFYADIGDSDNDGLPDLWERVAFNSLDQTLSDDTDHDGVSNAQEMLAGTDSVSVDSVLRMTLWDAGTTVVISIPDAAPRPVVVQYSADLTTGQWTNLNVIPVNEQGWIAPATVRDNPPRLPQSMFDLDWLSERTTARVTGQP